MIKKFSFLIIMNLCFIPVLLCQGENNDFMRSTGKIYVVVAVIAVIFFAIVGFLIYLERRISKLEKTQNNGE